MFQANNLVVRTWGEKRDEPKLKNHVDLVDLLEIADLKKGSYIQLFKSHCLFTFFNIL